MKWRLMAKPVSRGISWLSGAAAAAAAAGEGGIAAVPAAAGEAAGSTATPVGLITVATADAAENLDRGMPLSLPVMEGCPARAEEGELRCGIGKALAAAR